jgi:hypothetical protein
VNSITADSITLTSLLSSDASITIRTIHEGTTTKVYGSVSIVVNNVQSTSFLLNASAIIVQNAIAALGYNNISVVRLNADLNGHYSWRIFWADPRMPILDAYLSPTIVAQTNLIFPIYAREGVTLKWEHDLPIHEIQQIHNDRSFIGSITCTLLGATITFQATDGDSQVQQKFNLMSALYGNVIIQSNLLDATFSTTDRLAIFSEYPTNLARMNCVGLVAATNVIQVRTVQNGSLVPLGGHFKIGRLLSNGDYNYSIPISALSTTQIDVENAVSSLYSNGAVTVTLDVNQVKRKTWIVTFSGPTVGGDIPPLGVLSNLTGINAYAIANVSVHGAQPVGSVILTYGMRNVSLPVNSEAFVVADELASILPGIILHIYVYIYIYLYMYIYININTYIH